MSSPAEHVVALVRDGGPVGGKVRVGADGRLLRLDGDPDWPFLNEIQALADDPAATLMAPTSQLRRDPDRYLHLVWAPEAAGDLSSVEHVREEPDVLAALATGLREWSASGVRPSLRPDWYAPGWRAEVESWVSERLAPLGRRVSGPAELIRMWSLSAVLRLPTENGASNSGTQRGLTSTAAPGTPATDGGAVYFKATCPHFAGEPGITAVLSRHRPELLPDLVAVEVERSWMLMEPLPGAHPRPRRGEDAPPTAAAVARLQLDLASAGDELRAAGAADRRLEPTVGALEQVLTDSVEADRLTPEQRSTAGALGPWLSESLSELAACGLPYSISHGDLHTGNIAREGERLIIYDWTDAAVSFPSLDVSLLAASAGEEHVQATWESYAAVWRDAGHDVDLPRLVELSTVGRLAYQAVSYEQIFRSQERRVRWEMAGGVATQLKRLGELWPGRT